MRYWIAKLCKKIGARGTQRVLHNRAIQLISPTTMTSREESFQHLNILCISKLYSLSAGKIMNSYCKKLLPNHFDDCFISIRSNHSHFTKLFTSNNLFYLELAHPQENVPSHLLAQKCDPQFQTPTVFRHLHLQMAT